MSWSITVVYGPQTDDDKAEFLEELLQIGRDRAGAWMVCGDFNMIYQAADKNNDRLNRAAMRRFQSFIGRANLLEADLIGRRFTWSNHQENPTLERIDRVFGTTDWFHMFPEHCLKALSSDCSDHSPLLLLFCAMTHPKRRFRFESFWPKLPGFIDVVSAAWDGPVPVVDVCRRLDIKLRRVAKELQSWSSSRT